MKVIAIIVFLAAIAGAVVYTLMKKGVIKDEDGNNIPDVIDEKIKDVEVVVEEVKKVVESAKEAQAPKKRAPKKIVHSTPVENKPAVTRKPRKAQK